MANAAEIPQFDERENQRNPAARRELLGFPLSVGSSPESTANRGRTSSYRRSSLQGSSLDLVYGSVSDAIAACSPYLRSSAETAKRLGRRIKEMKEEKPFQLLELLGIVAGSTFVVGMMVRFWRSKS